MVKAAYVGAEDEEIKRDYPIIPILRIRYNVIDIKRWKVILLLHQKEELFH